MRLFLAIDFDADTKSRLLQVQDRLKTLGRGRFSHPDNFHLTLAYLGEVSKYALPKLEEIMDSLHVTPMDLSFDHVGTFYEDHAELWWIGERETPALMRLQNELMGKLLDAGFHPDTRSYIPHITLAQRMHIGQPDPRLILPRPVRTHADTVTLMVSHRMNGHQCYTPIYRVSCRR